MPNLNRFDPTEAHQPGKLDSPAIPIYQYTPDPTAEAEQYGPDALIAMYWHMRCIREVLTLIRMFQHEGHYHGIDYHHRAPSPIALGQEAAMVGLAYHLEISDVLFDRGGSYGGLLAKSFRAIELLPEDDLSRMMDTYLEGAPLRAMKNIPAGNVYDLATSFILYTTLAEIFGRSTGLHGGLGGGLHTFFPPFGIMPNTAIPGGSALLASGAAHFKLVNRQPGMVVANIDAAAIGNGSIWEALTYASTPPYHTQQDNGPGGLPVVFNIINATPGPHKATSQDVLARLGLAANPQAMHAERVHGGNPLAVADAFHRKQQQLASGDGPALLETIVPHIPSQAGNTAQATPDPIALFRDYLIDGDHITADTLDRFDEEIIARLATLARLATSTEGSPPIHEKPEQAEQVIFSGRQREYPIAALPDNRLPPEQIRLRITQNKRQATTPTAANNPLTYADAIFEAMFDHFYRDSTMVAYGQVASIPGHLAGAYQNLAEALPMDRLFDTKMSEEGIVGTAVGYAISGGRAVVTLQNCGTVGRAGGAIFDQMAKWQAISAGVLEMPLVVRVIVGGANGPQQPSDWSSIVAHIPGLKVYAPATPYDAKGMLNRALNGTDPVVFFENQQLYEQPETITPGGVPVQSYEVPEGVPAVRRQGTDLTLMTVGATLGRALEAASTLQTDYNVSAEVIDIRFLNPLDYELLIASLQKTGRVLLVSDAYERGAFMHTLASNLMQLAFDYLDGPVVVLGAHNWAAPPGQLTPTMLPQPGWIIDAIHERILPLPGHQPATDQTTDDILQRNKTGT